MVLDLWMDVLRNLPPPPRAGRPGDGGFRYPPLILGLGSISSPPGTTGGVRSSNPALEPPMHVGDVQKVSPPGCCS
jgi:hypothetical protein